METKVRRERMMKRLVAMAIGLIMVVGAQAQYTKKWALEGRIGICRPLVSTDERASMGPQFAVECRCNIDYTRVDVGVEFYRGIAGRNQSSMDWDYGAATMSLSAVGYVHLYDAQMYNLFAGAGIGAAELTPSNQEPGDKDWKPIFSPRVGIEFCGHYRITADMRLSKRRYCTFGIAFGYTL